MCGETKVKLQIWDTAGQEQYRTITTSYYRGSMCIILVYDVSDEQSFANVRHWMELVDQNASENVVRILIGNKCDVDPSDRKITHEQGSALAKEYGIKFYETSAKTNTNVDESFTSIAEGIVERLEENPHHYNPNSAGISAWDAKKSKERDAGLTGLEVECETIIAQVHATKELEQLQRELEAHKAAKTDYEAIGRTGKALREATAAVDSQLRAEKDWGTLRDRHVALVERLEVKCAALTEAENYDLLLRLGAKLNELKALDVSDLPQSRSNVSGLLPAPLAAPASAPAAVPHAQNADRA